MVSAENKIPVLLPINNIGQIGYLPIGNPLTQRCERFGIGDIGMAVVEGWMWIILQAEQDGFGQHPIFARNRSGPLRPPANIHRCAARL